MKPRSIRDGMRIVAEGDDVVVTVQSTGATSRLSRLTGVVYEHANGDHSVEELTALVSASLGMDVPEAAVWSALDRLADAGLLETRPAPPGGESIDEFEAGAPLSRRALLRRAGVAGAVAAGVAVGTAGPAAAAPNVLRALGRHLGGGEQRGKEEKQKHGTGGGEQQNKEAQSKQNSEENQKQQAGEQQNKEAEAKKQQTAGADQQALSSAEQSSSQSSVALSSSSSSASSSHGGKKGSVSSSASSSHGGKKGSSSSATSLSLSSSTSSAQSSQSAATPGAPKPTKLAPALLRRLGL